MTRPLSIVTHEKNLCSVMEQLGMGNARSAESDVWHSAHSSLLEE
ncbi:hypothetical protein [Pantoea sp. Nvir]|nr:hypothetical protein [Pantoea sp. Nvir]